MISPGLFVSSEYSIRESSGCQIHGQGLCAVHPDDLSLRILAFAERYESRDEPKPYTHIYEFEHQLDFSSTENSTEASNETRVNGTDFETEFCGPWDSYCKQEARGDRITAP